MRWTQIWTLKIAYVSYCGHFGPKTAHLAIIARLGEKWPVLEPQWPQYVTFFIFRVDICVQCIGIHRIRCKNRLTYSYSGSCRPWWSFAARTRSLHRWRSWAMFLQSSGLSTCRSARSLLMQSDHRSLGLPGGRRPSGWPSITLRSRLCSSMRATCPAQRSRWART